MSQDDLFLSSGVFREEAWTRLVPHKGFVRDYVAHHANVTDAYIPYHVGVALAVLSSVVHTELSVYQSQSALWPPLYVMLAGAAGHERKTHCIKLGLAVLRKAAPEVEASQPDSGQALVDVCIQREQESNAGGALKGAAQLLVPYPEFTGFLVNSKEGRYLASLKAEYLRAWDADPLSRSVVERVKKKQATRCERPRVSMLVGVATPMLEQHSAYHDWTGGFFSRFLIIYGARSREMATTLDPPTATFDHLVGMLKDLRACPQIGQCVGFAPGQAMDAWMQFNDLIAAKSREVSRDDKSSSVVSRLAPTALKIAMIYAYDLGIPQQSRQWLMPYDALAPAINMALVHLASTKHLLERICEGKDQRDMQVILDAINTVGVATLRDILNATKLMKRRVLECLETLLARGLVKRQSRNSVYVYLPGNPNDPEPGMGGGGITYTDVDDLH